MNKRRNPRHIMRILALALSIALVFSGMAVYYAAEGDGSTPAVVSDGDAQNPAGGTEGSGGQSGSGTVITPSDTPAGGQGGSGNVTTPSDTPAGGEGGSGSVTTPSDTPAGGEGGSGTVTTPSDVPSDSDAEEEKCPFCGGEYDSPKSLCYENHCHTHDVDYECGVCPECGGCDDAMYGFGLCYTADGKRCKGCTCFDLLFLYDEPSYSFSEAEVEEMKGKEEINVDLLSSVYALFGDGQLVSLSEFINDYGAKLTERSVQMDPIYQKAIFLNVPDISDTENGRFSFAFRNEVAAGNVIPLKVGLQVVRNGVLRGVDFELEIYITDGSEDFVKKVELAEGSEKLVLEAGKSSEVVYKVTMDDTHKNSFFAEALNTNGNSVDFDIVKDLEKMELTITVKALEVGKSDIIVSVGEGNNIESSVDVVRRTIKVEVVEPSAPAAPGGSVYFDPDTGDVTIKKGESVRLYATGWFAEPTRCYLPASWSVNPSGSWEIPDASECPVSDTVINSLLNQSTPELKNLAVKEHTGRVTFQGYERKADGWYPIDGDIYVGSAKLKVVDATSGGSTGNDTPGGLIKPDGGSNNGGNGGNGGGTGGNGGTTDGKGEAPGTGDIIRDNPGVRVAGIVMLIAGLFIFGTLAAERVYREMQDRKRQAAAVRR